MGNETLLSMLVLSGLSDLQCLQLPLFLFFLLLYLMTMISNVIILLSICMDSHLKTPMYFFLGCLACLDMCCSSVTAPRMLFDIHTKIRVISVEACITQLFFFIFFVIAEVFLLAVMSYDRYIAICYPLHYMQLMHSRLCVQMLSGILFLALVYSLVHTLCVLRLHFCGSNIVESFFCDLPQLFKLSCTDTTVNILLIILLGGVMGLAMTFIPYIRIFVTVLNIKEKNMRQKAFSTCISHLAVVFIFYGTLFFNYFRPATNYHFTEGRLISVFYTVFTPLLNPFVYSLRNQEFQSALRRVLRGFRIFNKNIFSSSL
uniref:Olfactory receptor n=1 Tax=Xenopus tropicalis TaxID=8364 RepID=A0A6I8S7Y5_XENTR